MHIETLKTFCDLVESGSFDKAARLNFVSQSAVSQQLKALETRYRQRLIDRGSRTPLAPTAAGRLFYAGCRELLAHLRQLDEQMRQPAGTIGGSVRLATVYSVGLHELPRHVKRFLQTHPGVKVHVEYSRTDKVRDACLQNTIDFGIVACPARHPRIEIIPWHKEKLVLVCPPGHPLARRRRVRLAAIAGQPFVAFERDIPTRKVIGRALRRHRVGVDIVAEFDNVETIKRSVEVGSGVSILPETTVARERENGLLVALELMEGPFTRDVAVIHRRGRTLNDAAREFIRMLVG